MKQSLIVCAVAVVIGAGVACDRQVAHEELDQSGPSTWSDSTTATKRLAELHARFLTPTLNGGRTAVIAPSTATAFERVAGGLRPIVPRPDRRSTAKVANDTLPLQATGSTRVEDEDSHLGVTFKVGGTTEVSVATANGLALYEHGGPQGSDIVLRPHAEGVEDYVVFEKKPEREELVYEVTLQNVAGLRLVSNVLEMLDESGTPRIRVAPPYAVDASGNRHPAKLAVGGCSFEVDPRAPYGHPLSPPRSSTCTLHVSWSSPRYPLLLDPSWGTTGAMTATRTGHSASTLPNGRVLIAGGGPTALPTAEIYDPATGTWSATGALNGARQFHSALVLSSGKVLVAAGSNSSTSVLTTSELYDPTTGIWTSTGSLQTGRIRHVAALLANGKVLIAGGRDLATPTAAHFGSAELYDPGVGTWTLTGAMGALRAAAATAVLSDGRMLVAGGFNPSSGVLNSSELYNPALGTWMATGAMGAKRAEATAIRLASGNVLAIGGLDPTTNSAATSEIYNPATGMWTGTNPMTAGHSSATASLLSSGKLLVVGGAMSPSTSADLFDPVLATWTATDSLAASRYQHTATILGSGKVLVAGGGGPPSAELFLFASGSACGSNADCASSFCTDGVCCTAACSGQCQSCNEPASKGTCTTITGKPRGMRPVCPGDGTVCAGQCDGTNTTACTSFPPVTTVCGCAGSSIATCNGSGTCLAPVACQGNLVCDGATACKTKCAGDTDCVTGFACTKDGTCQPQQGATCTDDHTSKSVDGVSKDCAPFKCSTAGTCLAQCTSVADCVSPNVCSPSGQCIASNSDGGDGGGCTMTPPRGELSSGSVLACMLALAGVVRSRRRSQTVTSR